MNEPTSDNVPDVKRGPTAVTASPLKTAVDISEKNVERATVTLRLCAQAHYVAGNDATSDELKLHIDMLRALRNALTACEKQREEAVRLLRAVGAGGIFTLMAESSDDADVWYDQRDAILKGKF